MKRIQVAEPASEPLALEDMKVYLRMLHSEDDTRISSLIKAAREKAEKITNCQMVEATYALYLDAPQDIIKLTLPPFVSLESFQAFDGDTWNDVTDYDLDDKAIPAILHVDSWPTVSEKRNSIKVLYKCGYSDAKHVPASIKTWMCIEVEKMYDEESPRIDVDALLSQHRIIPL